jgi:hypothetical protein
MWNRRKIYILWLDVSTCETNQSKLDEEIDGFSWLSHVQRHIFHLVYSDEWTVNEFWNLWRHRQFITIFYQFLHIRIEIIHGSHMYILLLPRVGLYVSFVPLADARGKTSWHKGLPVVKTIYAYGFHVENREGSREGPPSHCSWPCRGARVPSFIWWSSMSIIFLIINKYNI